MVLKKFTAPCVGGPLEGCDLPYVAERTPAGLGIFNPSEYVIYNSNGSCPGRYEFFVAGAERRGTGDTWVWHPFVGKHKEAMRRKK